MAKIQTGSVMVLDWPVICWDDEGRPCPPRPHPWHGQNVLVTAGGWGDCEITLAGGDPGTICLVSRNRLRPLTTESEIARLAASSPESAEHARRAQIAMGRTGKPGGPDVGPSADLAPIRA